MMRYQVRVYDYSTCRDPRGICSEDFYPKGDPFVFARRILKLDEMREEGCGYTRAEVYESYQDGFTGWVGWALVRTIRLSKRQRERWRELGAIQRGVRRRGKRAA